MAEQSLYHHLRNYSLNKRVKTYAKNYAIWLVVVGAGLLYLKSIDIPKDET